MTNPYPTTNFIAFKDETLFSIAARACMLSAYPSASARDELLNSRNRQMDSFFPAYVPELAEATSISKDLLIHEHSILDFFKPFVPKKIYDEIYLNMLEGATKNIHSRLSLVANHLPLHVELRYCKICVAMDQVEVGCKYWHRQHQLPGTMVCVKHQIPLSTCSRSRKTLSLPPSEDFESISNYCSTLSLDFSQACDQILNGKIDLDFNPQFLKATYLKALHKKGFACSSLRIKQNKLRCSLCTYWEELMDDKLIEAIFKKKKTTTYPVNLLYSIKSIHHPIKHILIILFLFENLTNFLESYKRGVNPNNNPVLQTTPPKERKDPINILKKQILEMLSTGSGLRKVARTLRTSIHFVKQTALQNQVEIDRRPSKIFNQERRSIWRKLHMGRSTQELAKEFEVSVGAIEKILNTHPILIELRKKIRFFEKRTTERESLLKYINHHRTALRNEVRLNCNKAYIWLFKNDSAWLYEHLPPAIPRTARYNRSKLPIL
ncbi:hypothetical protein CBP51_03245 [Cellvibrio mixtus]|uniref:Uncharacterized protein n=1 Tax=Cellvibrio mixtus TaxID=39650 RepID=A0A266Q9N1_9GAMM|nr:TnsD family Tn7-like transposition protein [Cellvibrio mixtus]OZY86061.1 hypothetical protein CBP51_03245 [Cellvibrio mixtus]